MEHKKDELFFDFTQNYVDTIKLAVQNPRIQIVEFESNVVVKNLEKFKIYRKLYTDVIDEAAHDNVCVSLSGNLLKGNKSKAYFSKIF